MRPCEDAGHGVCARTERQLGPAPEAWVYPETRQRCTVQTSPDLARGWAEGMQSKKRSQPLSIPAGSAWLGLPTARGPPCTPQRRAPRVPGALCRGAEAQT